MKKLTGWWMVAAFCGAARLVWAGNAVGSNKVTPPFLPPNQNQKAISGQTGKVKPIPKMNSPKNGKSTQKTVPKVGKEVLVNYMEGDPDKPIVTGQTHNGAAITGGRQYLLTGKSANVVIKSGPVTH